MADEINKAAEAATKEPKVGHLGAFKAAGIHEEAARKAAKAASKESKQAIKIDSSQLAKSAKEAAKENHALVQQAAETGGKELTGLRKLMFKAGNTRIGGLIARNPKKSIALGVAALGTLMVTMRSKRKELPPEERLTPQIPAPQMEMDAGPVDGFAADKWQKTVRPERTAPTAPAR